jgi:Ni,Fe-hydrogenase III large subunit
VSAIVIVLAIPLSLLRPRHGAGASSAGSAPATFVGSSTCRDCHKAAYDKWKGSDHERAMDVATDRTVLARSRGVGRLSREDAAAYGAVGPVARASGIDVDLRRDDPYLAYRQLAFAVPTRPEGDVLARVVVRALEMVQSCAMVEQALQLMPAGPINVGDVYAVPAGEAVMRVEAPRGEVFYYVASDGSDTPTRVKVRTPSFLNIPTVAAMVIGSDLADVPLIQAAVDPCYSCTDR